MWSDGARCPGAMGTPNQSDSSSPNPLPRLLIRQALFVNLARAEVSKPLDGLKLNGIGTLQ